MASSNIITPSDDDDFIDPKGEKRILIFSATWCGPCKTYKKMWESEAAKNPDIKFIYIDIDNCPDTASDYKVVSIPTTLIYNTKNFEIRFGGAKLGSLQGGIADLK